VNNLRLLTSKYDRQRFALRKFMKEQKIPRELVMRVTRYSDCAIRPRQRGIAIQSVELLKLLPRGLYMEVMLQVYLDDIQAHPLFKWMDRQGTALLREICSSVIERHYYSQGGLLFSSGKAASCMYFVGKGRLLYLYKPPYFGAEEEKTQVYPAQWFCEPVLWTAWVHQGTMCAIQDSELLQVNSEKFMKVVSDHRPDRWFLMKYAEEFVKRMNEIAALPAEDQQKMAKLSDLLEVNSAVSTLPGGEELSGTFSAFNFLSPGDMFSQ
jgi:CRP-like cAMP-binding protein